MIMYNLQMQTSSSFYAQRAIMCKLCRNQGVWPGTLCVVKLQQARSIAVGGGPAGGGLGCPGEIFEIRVQNPAFWALLALC